ncbi:ferritin-like domain-containing protein [Paenibacillus methanolicus]|uniref:Rubrerythrin n=1 Tax=Paenibacillus methanolicus TaxID=582686 RepID=A0A5S5CB60_9BACL|nr:ferritin-like domain-containing protein [Paenibacillus methanolicus]TYP76594.1 hypothetical protein BCM02_103256 [Paenibacillus methanolicus]
MPLPYTAMRESLQLIQTTANAESNTESFYRKLIELAPSEEARTIIASIRDDERKHLNILREIYAAFTGRAVQLTAPITMYKDAASYEEGLKEALFNKWTMVQRAGSILAAMPTGYYQNLIAKIAIDNVAIVSKWNYLLAPLRR